MILYHFTGLRQLLGEEGFAKVSPGVEVDLMALAAPGSILASGIKPHRNAELEIVGRPCVWLTTNPDMPEGLNSWSGWRISVVIPDKDRRLSRFMDGISLGRPSSSGLSDALQREGDRFYVWPD